MAARHSLRVELIATLAVVLMMAAVSLSLATELLGRHRHDLVERERLIAHAHGLSVLLTPLLGADAPAHAQRSEIERTLRPSIGSRGIETIVVYRQTPGGVQAVATMGLLPDLPAAAPLDDGANARAEQADGGYTVVDRAIRTFRPDRHRSFLRVVARPATWTRVADWPELLVLGAGIGLLLLVLGVLLLELQVLRPLAHVRAAVGEVTRGNLKARVPEEGPTEVQALAGAFNEMTAALAQRVQEIESQRARLVRAEQLASVGRISAGIAHEVGNPLAAIGGYVQLLLDPRTDPPPSLEQRGLLERCRQQIERIQGIVGQLLEYSRPSRQQVRDVEVVASTHQLLALLQHDPRCKGVALQVEAEAPVSARADAALLDQVLSNLVINGARAAREHDREHPTVVVRIEAEGDVVQMDVEDSGAGVPEGLRAELFEPFFTTAKAGEGTGLGLALCQGLVEGMGGELSLIPEPGSVQAFSGARFRVKLPRGLPSSGANGAEPLPRPPGEVE